MAHCAVVTKNLGLASPSQKSPGSISRTSNTPSGGRLPPPSSLDRNDLKRISLRSRAFLTFVFYFEFLYYNCILVTKVRATHI